MNFRFLAMLISLFMLTSCFGQRSDREHLPPDEMFLGVVPYDQFKPVPYRKRPFDYMPAGDDSYSQGYQAGCQTMASAVASGLWRTKGPKIEPDRLSYDAWYLRGFEDASTACTFNFDWELH